MILPFRISGVNFVLANATKLFTRKRSLNLSIPYSLLTFRSVVAATGFLEWWLIRTSSVDAHVSWRVCWVLCVTDQRVHGFWDCCYQRAAEVNSSSAWRLARSDLRAADIDAAHSHTVSCLSLYTFCSVIRPLGLVWTSWYRLTLREKGQEAVWLHDYVLWAFPWWILNPTLQSTCTA